MAKTRRDLIMNLVREYTSESLANPSALNDAMPLISHWI